MPYVDIRVNPKIYRSAVIDRLIEIVPTIVAEELSTRQGTNGTLTKDEIDVTVLPYGSRDIFHHDIGIKVFANDYPERSQNLAQRTQRIKDAIEKRLKVAQLVLSIQMKSRQTFKCFVWVLLLKGDFKEFTMPLTKDNFP